MKKLTLISAAAILLLAPAIYGVTITVDGDGPADHTSIQDAIDAAVSGTHQIEVRPGTYNEAIDFKGKAIRLYSTDGPDVTTIDGTGHYHVVQCVTGEGPSTVLEGFTITGGNATGGGAHATGGGMLIRSSSPAVTHCIFIDNKAIQGGAMSVRHDARPMVSNCLFIGNSASSGGGAVYSWSERYDANGALECAPVLTNCTFSNNSAAHGAGIYSPWSYPTLTNCIFWGDTPDEILGDTATVTYSNVQGGSAGAGNIEVDPHFMDPAEGDFLPGAVECVDAGDNSAVPPGVTTDVRGKSRFADDPNIPDTGSGTSPIVDMGACERQPDDVLSTLTVDDDGPAGFSSIQEAIDYATDRDLIQVRPGTYFESIDFKGKAVTLISTDGPDLTIIDGNGANHVVQCVSGEDLDTILEGFTISGGDANLSVPDVNNYSGGGMFCQNSSPTVSNCRFEYNSAEGRGGGMYNLNNSSPRIMNCIFKSNTSFEGAGMANEMNSNPTVINCIFSNNVPVSMAGGMLNDSSEPNISECTFSDEVGGMYNWMSNVTVTGCTFRDNISNEGGEGGGIFNYRSNLEVTDCVFSNNKVSMRSGGITCQGETEDCIIKGCTFIGNSAGTG
ncbi:MAG: right-handed parallel beta-helix repeat-containing protein, partial [Planctomycetota bacterium]